MFPPRLRLPQDVKKRINKSSHRCKNRMKNTPSEAQYFTTSVLSVVYVVRIHELSFSLLFRSQLDHIVDSKDRNRRFGRKFN